MRSPHSYSAYSTFLRCPPAYRACYIEGDPGVTPAALKNGAGTHEAIARYAAHCFNKGRKSDLEEGRRIALGYMEPVRELVEKFVEDWRFEWGATIVEGVAPVEQEFRAMLPDGKTEFSGHLDMLQRYEGAASVEEVPFGEEGVGDGDDALWTITDLKSGLYGDCWNDEVAPKQLQWYAWLVQQNYPQARAFKVCLYSIRTGYTLEWQLGGDLSYIGHELQAIADRIAREEEWEPCPGPACLTCLHVHCCPLKDSETVRAITDIPPETTLQLYLWHKAQYAALNGLLKEHVQQTGETVRVGEVAYGSQVPAPGVKVRDYAGLVALALEADEALRTPKSRLPGVARLLKPEKDVAALLLEHPDYHERAMQLLTVNAPGKPRIGLLGNGHNGGDDDDA